MHCFIISYYIFYCFVKVFQPTSFALMGHMPGPYSFQSVIVYINCVCMEINVDQYDLRPQN